MGSAGRISRFGLDQSNPMVRSGCGCVAQRPTFKWVSQMHKLSHFLAHSWAPFSHGPVYAVSFVDATERLIAGVPAGDALPFATLVASLSPPYLLLFVLHTSRGEGAEGRYQSPALSLEEFQDFIGRFGAFLSGDARFDIWAYSVEERATIVWDRHDQIFAYGPIGRYQERLNALGFELGDPRIPVPHQHHYREEFDVDAKALLVSLPWTYSALRPEDAQ
ncbi:hypothetical protein EDF71_10189 [Comamonas sp. JUb58]|nr:hypothetical protein EDF71_10189 [Comamonas sp. JUb58]